MTQLTLAKLSLADLRSYVDLREYGIGNYAWTQIEAMSLSEQELRQVQDLQSHLLNVQTHLMNEATIWSRAIYPLLLLAERGPIQAWAEVPLRARYPRFELESTADGVLGWCVAGLIEAPYLVVVEAKRGLEATNPQFQLYGQMLAAAWMNWERDRQSPQEMFGCYTIADTWTFLRAEISEIETEKPVMRIETSREYAEKLEAATILKILIQIVNRRATELSLTH